MSYAAMVQTSVRVVVIADLCEHSKHVIRNKLIDSLSRLAGYPGKVDVAIIERYNSTEMYLLLPVYGAIMLSYIAINTPGILSGLGLLELNIVGSFNIFNLRLGKFIVPFSLPPVYFDRQDARYKHWFAAALITNVFDLNSNDTKDLVKAVCGLCAAGGSLFSSNQKSFLPFLFPKKVMDLTQLHHKKGGLSTDHRSIQLLFTIATCAG